MAVAAHIGSTIIWTVLPVVYVKNRQKRLNFIPKADVWKQGKIPRVETWPRTHAAVAFIAKSKAINLWFSIREMKVGNTTEPSVHEWVLLIRHPGSVNHIGCLSSMARSLAYWILSTTWQTKIGQ